MSDDQGMTFPRTSSHAEPDPLTDSGVHRLGLGTQVRLHLYGETHVDCGLLAIRDVSNWQDLVARIVRGQIIEVMASRRRVFGGGAVMWAEVLTDPIEDTATPLGSATPRASGTPGLTPRPDGGTPRGSYH